MYQRKGEKRRERSVPESASNSFWKMGVLFILPCPRVSRLWKWFEPPRTLRIPNRFSGKGTWWFGYRVREGKGRNLNFRNAKGELRCDPDLLFGERWEGGEEKKTKEMEGEEQKRREEEEENQEEKRGERKGKVIRSWEV
ncbi:hypothetical protein IE53DRAFT_260622 [Violaceomyces palustris]|uniref:Uncharacterized protein n=1 Tax=Violaceomyces palustris TaxID=1673888 RepID=A0ACD0P3J8_9BASI|nr:hypothetical protein IE53DRAFT_260622 [Violaceomyces palustris]